MGVNQYKEIQKRSVKGRQTRIDRVYVKYMTIKIVMIGTIIATLLMSGVAAAYAGGPRHDYPENYDNVPGAPQCWTDGFDDGANDSFDDNRDGECADKGDLYSRGFNAGKESCTEENLARSSANENDCNAAREEADT